VAQSIAAGPGLATRRLEIEPPCRLPAASVGGRRQGFRFEVAGGCRTA
jgi:hypothetical protein